MHQKERINREEVYNYITELALRLFKDKEKYSRADVAFELKAKGIEYDSTFVEELIFAAYKLSNSKEVRTAIKKVFFNNQLTRPLIEEGSVHDLLYSQSYEEAITRLNKDANKAIRQTKQFNKDFANLINEAQNYVAKKQLLSKISGAYEIEDVKSEAKHVLDLYELAIDKYQTSKQSIADLIEDFTLLRNEVLTIYRTNLTLLTDVFGSKIKAVEPNLFNFELIEWLETEAMIKNIQLEFDNIMSSCSTIILQINSDFKTGVSNAVKIMGRGKNNALGFAMLGLELFSSWSNSEVQATKLRQELEVLKHKMNHDVALVSGDLCRLEVINKKIKDIHIPTADAFMRYSNKALTTEVENLLAVLHQDKKIKRLQLEKDKLLETYSSLEKSIINHQNEIENYSFRIKQSKEQLMEYKPIYLNAKKLEPSKPFFLFNLLSLGMLKKSYNRDVAEWYEKYFSTIESYNMFEEDLLLDKEELKAHKKALNKEKLGLSRTSKIIEKQSQQIYELIKENGNIQAEFAKHLTPLVNLLRAARMVIELKMDESHLTTVKISEVEMESLPLELEKRLAKVTGSIANDIKSEVQNVDLSDQLKFALDEKEQELVKDKAVQIIDNIGNLVEALAALKKMEVNNDIANETYRKELDALREKYKTIFLEEESRASALREVMKTVKTGSGIEVRDALLELVDEKDGYWATELEIIESLKSDTDIII